MRPSRRSRRKCASGSRGRSRSPRPRRCRPGRRSPRRPRARLGAHRLRQDARRLPVGARPLRRRAAAADPRERTLRLVYISPLKALGYDVERNLRAPLRGIGADVRVAVRTGDTPQRERRGDAAHARRDILITTPESLYLMLTSQARELFAAPQWSSSTRSTRSRRPSAARTWRSRSSGWPCRRAATSSASASRRPSGRWTRSPGSSSAPAGSAPSSTSASQAARPAHPRARGVDGRAGRCSRARRRARR